MSSSFCRSTTGSTAVCASAIAKTCKAFLLVCVAMSCCDPIKLGWKACTATMPTRNSMAGRGALLVSMLISAAHGAVPARGGEPSGTRDCAESIIHCQNWVVHHNKGLF
eukprot:4206086-Pleurochrysis_carterae.AAC.4